MRWVGSLRGASSHCVRPRRDVVPTADSLSFASPKESKQRKGDPTVAVRLRRTALRCSVFGASRPTRFVRCAHAAQTNVAKSVHEARYRARPQTPALLDATHGDPNTRFASLRIGSMTRRLRLAPDAKRGGTGKVAKQRPYCSWGPSEPSSSAGLCSGVRSTLRKLTSRGCLSAADAGRVASSARAAKTEQRRAVGPRPTGEGGRLSFAYFSLAKQRTSRSAVGTTSRRGLTQ